MARVPRTWGDRSFHRGWIEGNCLLTATAKGSMNKCVRRRRVIIYDNQKKNHNHKHNYQKWKQTQNTKFSFLFSCGHLVQMLCLLSLARTVGSEGRQGNDCWRRLGLQYPRWLRQFCLAAGARPIPAHEHPFQGVLYSSYRTWGRLGWSAELYHTKFSHPRLSYFTVMLFYIIAKLMRALWLVNQL